MYTDNPPNQTPNHDDVENIDELDWAYHDLQQSDASLVEYHHVVRASEVGMRLDKLASDLLADFSRANIQKIINDGKLVINGLKVKPKYIVKLGDVLDLQTQLVAHGEDLPEDIALDIVYEDETVLVINKPAGLVVHPGANNRTGTLVNALLYHDRSLSHLPRAGLVHRIDKDTTGLLVVAKTVGAQLNLINQLKDKSVYRHYRCIVVGTPNQLAAYRCIDAPIARHATQRTKMAVRSQGKPAMTDIIDITPIGEFFCLLDVSLQTGRTHQIRVHLSHVGHALVGDKTYQARLPKDLNNSQRQAIDEFGRQALHAYKLGFVHPATGELMTFVAKMPSDMQALIIALDNACQSSKTT